MFLKKILAAALLSLVCLSINCSLISEISNGEKEVSYSQIRRIHNQIESGEFKQIYAESSKSLRSRHSEEEFINLMKKAIEKMKDVDETLSFQESALSRILPKLLNNEYRSSTCFEKLEGNGKKLEVFSQWGKEKEADNFRLTALVIMEPSEEGKYEAFYV
jgi:hypothetical protein